MRNKSRFSKALMGLAEADCEVEILKTDGPGHAMVLTGELVRRNDPGIVIVAAGGDGTVSEILNGLQGSALPLGVIPLGTANVLARELGIGVSISKAVRTLVTAEPVCVHTARANGKRFLLMVGAGYDSLAVAALNSDQKRRFGAFAYVLAAVRAVRQFNNMELEVTVDGVVYLASSVIVTKVRHYGGPFVIARDSGLDKPRFDVLILKGGGILNAIRYGIALLSNQLPELADVDAIWTDEDIYLTAKTEFPCQHDGDAGLSTPVRISLDKSALWILKSGSGG
ncbi:MAG: hypothetical protein K9G33_11910 [Sneathiella sp.]|nr:hypothetical protein [Sneathiella sp.]